MTEEALRELLVQTGKGDREAFGAVYRELKQPVYTICFRITRSRETAEDITHDLFVKLYCDPPDASVRNVRAWIFRSARNLAIDALRRQSKTAAQQGDIPAADHCDRVHMRMDMEAALGKLPREEREILTLRLNADLSFREIAGIVEQSLPAVYRRYRKALKCIRTELNGG